MRQAARENNDSERAAEAEREGVGPATVRRLLIQDALSLKMTQSVPVAQVPWLQNDCIRGKLSIAGQ